MENTYVKSLEKNQKVLYIGTLFNTVSVNPQTISVKERFDGVPYQIEVVSSGSFINYRILKDRESLTLWDSLNNMEEVKEMFRRNSFI